MAFQTKPGTRTINLRDKIWGQTFNLFNAQIYVPHSELPGEIINYGYSAPYLLIFGDRPLSDKEILDFADSTGLGKIAASYETSIVFINPVNQGGWENAPEGIFEEIIENSKIHQYHQEGFAILNNRFFHRNEGFAIRGAIFRTIIIAKDSAADYVATKLLKTINGAGLWGPAVVTPVSCILKNLSVMPQIQRRDIPLVSVSNSSEINNCIKENCDFYQIQDKASFEKAFDFLRLFKRWGWVGDLSKDEDFNEIGMTEEAAVVELKTSKDNAGDDAGTKTHKVGYLAYYNKELFNQKRSVPLVLCFHGGGDSAKHIAQVSQWYKVAHDHNFLLVCVENHINSTATEMMELLQILKSRYSIEESRIYATGFSMGGCKTWDLFQEYPDVFAALAPMDATFDHGCNLYGQPSPGLGGSGVMNQNILVPVFYTGGEETPLPELPFQAQKCMDRMKYVLEVNNCNASYNVTFENQKKWENKIWGISGDLIQKIPDNSRNSILTINYFISRDGNIYTAFGSISGQGHECRYHTCEYAWRFMSKFSRSKEGKILTELKSKGNSNELI